MGTYYQVRLYDFLENEAVIRHGIEKELAKLNQEFSTYVDDSLISKINNGELINLDNHHRFRDLITESLEISKETQGYFDITVGSLVKLWGFHNAGTQPIKKPSKKKIQSEMKFVGYQKFNLKDNVIFKPKEMRLDMSANAKGLAVDELSKYLLTQKFTNHFVEIGGETKALGKKGVTEKDKDLWRVGVEGPSTELGGSIVEVVPLKNTAIATSGNYRNFIKYGDEVFGHTLNPLTGYPIENQQISATVLNSKCSVADSYATALMAMPFKKAKEFIMNKNIKALLIYREDKKLLKFYSNALKKYLGKE